MRRAYRMGAKSIGLSQRSSMALTRCLWLERTGVATNALGLDLNAPPTLNFIIQTASDWPRRHKRLHQRLQQGAAECPVRLGRPNRRTVIGLKLMLLTPAQDPQHGCDRTAAWRQNRTDRQNLRVQPNHAGEVRRKDPNQAGLVVGQGNAAFSMVENAALPCSSNFRDRTKFVMNPCGLSPRRRFSGQTAQTSQKREIQLNIFDPSCQVPLDNWRACIVFWTNRLWPSC